MKNIENIKNIMIFMICSIFWHFRKYHDIWLFSNPARNWGLRPHHWEIQHGSSCLSQALAFKGGATGGVGGHGGPLFGPGGTGGYRGRYNENDLCFYSIQYCRSDWISTPLTLVDTCRVNDIWKDGLGRVSTVHVHPHWTAVLLLGDPTWKVGAPYASPLSVCLSVRPSVKCHRTYLRHGPSKGRRILFKSTCQHAHAAVNWLSMSLSRRTCQISLVSIVTFLLLLH